MKLEKGSASRKQLIEWLANALRWVPPNVCDAAGHIPPPWVKAAKAELKRNGIILRERKRAARRSKPSKK